MKKILNIILLASVFFFGCKKNDKRYPFDVPLERVPYINVKVDPTGSQAIDVLNLSKFDGKYSVELLYPNDVKPDKVDVVIIKNGDKTNPKILQANVTTFPSTFSVTAAQLATLFGAPVVLGNSFDIGVDIYKNDRKYEAFPLGSQVVAYGGTGQANQPGFAPIANFSAICAYDPAIYEGNFVVVSDAFGELSPGAVVTLTRVTPTSVRVSYPNPSLTPQPTSFLVNVNTGNNVVTVPVQQVGTNFYQYTNPTFENTTGASSNVTPCDKEIRIGITYKVAQGSFGGPFVLRLRKQ